jgi:ATP-dependent helicase/nuclease subunit B
LIPEKILNVLESHGMVVVPTVQRAQALHLAYAKWHIQQNRQVWPTPAIYALDAWVAEFAVISDTSHRLSALDEWSLWREMTERNTQHLPWANSGVLAESLQTAQRLALEYQLDISKIIADCAEHDLLKNVYQQVEEYCVAHDWQSVHPLNVSLKRVQESSVVLFAGFNLPTLQLKTLWSRLRAEGVNIQVVSSGLAVNTPVVEVQEAENTCDEMLQIAQWCRNKFIQNADSRLLVVWPGTASEREQLTNAIQQCINPAAWLDPHQAAIERVVIEGGEVLTQFPVVQHALQTLHYLQDVVEFTAFTEWLRAPYWDSPGFSERCQLDAELSQLASERFTLEQLLQLLSKTQRSSTAGEEVLKKIATAISGETTQHRSLREWLLQFQTELQIMGWPGCIDHEAVEQQVHQRFCQLLLELGTSALQSAAPLSRTAALACVVERCAKVYFRPAAADPLVTITASLSDPIVRYAGIWVAGLTATAWPPSVDFNPFLPTRMQIDLGMPSATPTGCQAYAEVTMAAWQAAADELVLSTPKRNAQGDCLPSPLLRNYGTPSMRRKSASWWPLSLSQKKPLEYYSDITGLPWACDLSLPGGSYGLQMQSDCAFRAYAELRLGAKRLEMPEPGVSKRDRGKLLHGALEHLWAGWRHSDALRNRPLTQRQQDVSAAVRQASHTLWGEKLNVEQRRECSRTEKVIYLACELESRRAVFSVQAVELNKNLQLAQIGLRLRIDRVDQLEDGSLIILDYKSGTDRTLADDWNNARSSHVQLQTYAMVFMEPVRAVAAFYLNAREMKFKGASVEDNLLPQIKKLRGDQDWNAHCQRWREQLTLLAQQFAQGHAAVDPRPKSKVCDHCHLHAACRIRVVASDD